MMDWVVLGVGPIAGILLALAPPALGQSAAVSQISKGRLEAQVSDWTRARNWTRDYLATMPEDALSFRPVPEVRSFAGQMTHLAAANWAFGELVTGRPHVHSGTDLWQMREPNTKAGLTTFVIDSYDYVIESLRQLDSARLDDPKTYRDLTLPGWHVLAIAYEHQTHHRGQTTLYLRLKGIVPPPEPF